MSDINTDLATLRKLVVEACRAFEDLHPDYFLDVSYGTVKVQERQMNGETRTYRSNPSVTIKASVGIT